MTTATQLAPDFVRQDGQTRQLTCTLPVVELHPVQGFEHGASVVNKNDQLRLVCVGPTRQDLRPVAVVSAQFQLADYGRLVSNLEAAATLRGVSPRDVRTTLQIKNWGAEVVGRTRFRNDESGGREFGLHFRDGATGSTSLEMGVTMLRLVCLNGMTAVTAAGGRATHRGDQVENLQEGVFADLTSNGEMNLDAMLDRLRLVPFRPDVEQFLTAGLDRTAPTRTPAQWLGNKLGSMFAEGPFRNLAANLEQDTFPGGTGGRAVANLEEAFQVATHVASHSDSVAQQVNGLRRVSEAFNLLANSPRLFDRN
jgi:hypothetical protein